MIKNKKTNVKIPKLRSLPSLLGLAFLVITIFTFKANAQDCSVNAGVPATFCLGDQMPLIGGTSGRPQIGTQEWVIVSAPAGSMWFINDPFSLSTFSNADAVGDFVFRLLTDCNRGSAFQDVTYTVLPVPTIVNPGPDQTVSCYTGGSILLDNTNRTLGGTDFDESWNVVSGPSGEFSQSGGDWYFTPNYGSLTDFNCDFQDCGIPMQDFVFRYTLTNKAEDSCYLSTTAASHKTLTVNFADVPFLPGAANDVCVRGPSCDAINAPYVVRGRCAGSGSGQWSIRPALGISFSNPIGEHSVITGLVPGQTYTVLWDVSGRTCGIDGKDSITFTVGDYRASTGADASTLVNDFCTNIPSVLTLSGNNPATGETGTWTQGIGNPVTINSASSTSTTASGFTALGGPYSFLYTIDNGSCPSTDSILITVNQDVPRFDLNDISQCIRDNALVGIPIADNISYDGPLSQFSALQGRDSMGRMRSPNFDIEIISTPTEAIPFLNSGTNWAFYPSISRSTIYPGKASIRFNVTNATYSPYSRTPAGAYVLQLTGRNACGSNSDEVVINVGLNGETAINAGTDQILPCQDTFTELAGNILELPHWEYLGSEPSGAPTPFFTTTQDTAFPSIAGLQGGYTYNYKYSSGRGQSNCDFPSDVMQVVASNLPPPSPAIYTDTSFCGGTDIKLDGELLPGLVGRWKLLSGNAGTTIEDTTIQSTYLLGVDVSSTYEIEWSVRNGCGSTRDTLVINTNANQGPTRANLVDDICIGFGSFGTRDISAAPIDANTTGSWNLITEPGPTTNLFNQTISGNERFRALPGRLGPVDSTSADVGIYLDPYGGYQVSWTTRDTAGLCPASIDTLNIGFLMAEVATDVLVAECNTASVPINLDLNSSIFDNNFTGNDGNILSKDWSLSTGDFNAVTIANPEDDTTETTITSYGFYTFVRTVNLSGCVREVDVQVAVYPPAAPAIAGPDTALCSNYLNLPMRATDVPFGQGFWRIDSGAGGTFEPISDFQVHDGNFLPNVGTTKLMWNSFNDAPCASEPTSDSVYVSYRESVAAGENDTLCEAGAIALLGSNPQPGYGVWSTISGPNTPNFVSSDTVDAVLPVAVDGLRAGTYQFQLEVTSPGCPQGLDTVVIVIDSISVKPNAGLNDTLCMPNGGTVPITLTGNTPPIGYTATWTKELGTGPDYTVESTSGTYTASEAEFYQFSYEFNSGFCTEKDFVSYVFLESAPEADITLTSLNACNDSVTAFANPASLANKFTYSWEFDNANPSDTSGLDLDDVGTVIFTEVGSQEVRLLISGNNPQCDTRDTVLVSVSCAVPVELVSLSAELSGPKDVLVTWLTASELNNDYFEVQRRFEHEAEFSTVSNLITGHGTTFQLHKYTYLDRTNNWLSPVSYYRLRQVDFDGTVSYTYAVAVTKESDLEISIFPNPASDKITVVILSNGKSDTKITLTDMYGKDLNSNLSVTDLGGIYEVDLSAFRNGTYFITVQSDGDKTTERILIAR